MADYKWERPNNAAVLHSGYFVEKFLNRSENFRFLENFSERIRWKVGFEKDGARWLNECYRERVGHMETALDKPGLFETLESQKVDLVLMDNLHDSHARLLCSRAKSGETEYSFPFSLSRCENEQELAQDFYYGPPLEAEESVFNWKTIVRFIKNKQPNAQIIFYCAHSCTSIDIPDQYNRICDFYQLFSPLETELGITIIPPLNLPLELTKMPDDRDHFENRVYRAMAGQIFLTHTLWRSQSIGQN
jgi:hypothetical protein